MKRLSDVDVLSAGPAGDHWSGDWASAPALAAITQKTRIEACILAGVVHGEIEGGGVS